MNHPLQAIVWNIEKVTKNFTQPSERKGVGPSVAIDLSAGVWTLLAGAEPRKT